MTTFLLAISTLLVALAVGGFIYHLWWMLVALVMQSKRVDVSSSPGTHFAIVIPAHNEESILQATLDSCRAIDYPEELFSVFVIADNCSDATADIAGQSGVQCLERFDSARRGKGYALAWAFPQVLESGVDAVVVLDADCEIDANSLTAIDSHISGGARVLQLNNVTQNPSDSPVSFLLAVANKLENDYYYAPKSCIGAAVFLRGTGMVLSGDVLRRFPWEAFSIVEDTDYSLQLLNAGERVHFVPESRVVSAFPSEYRSLGVQRSRWVGGTLAFSLTRGIQLLSTGICRLNPRMADAGLTLLTLNRALIVCELILAWVATLSLMPSAATSAIALIAALSIASIGYVAYAAVGVLTVDRQSLSLKHFLLLPITTASYILIALRSIISAKSGEWVKTPRGEDV